MPVFPKLGSRKTQFQPKDRGYVSEPTWNSSGSFRWRKRRTWAHSLPTAPCTWAVPLGVVVAPVFHQAALHMNDANHNPGSAACLEAAFLQLLYCICTSKIRCFSRAGGSFPFISPSALRWASRHCTELISISRLHSPCLLAMLCHRAVTSSAHNTEQSWLVARKAVTRTLFTGRERCLQHVEQHVLQRHKDLQKSSQIQRSENFSDKTQ